MPPGDAIERRYSLSDKLLWLILARLAIAILRALARVLWVHGVSWQSWLQMFPALSIVSALTVAYLVAHRFSQNYLLQARIQFVLDIILVTSLVWSTNVIYSPYIALYIVIIAASSLFLGPRDSIVISVVCVVAFTATALVLLTGLGGADTPEYLDANRPQAYQALGLFDIYCLVVGLLSARLAERQSRFDVRLIAATQSLANLRALHERIVASIRSGVVTTDLQGRIYTFNAAAEEITGYKEQDVRGQDASIFFGEIKDIIQDSMGFTETPDSSPRFEADCLTADGLRLRLGFSLSPLSAETGETTGTVITFQDLTHIRALEETSRRQDRLAAIGRMAASIAHEIRNPLAAMRGSIQMLRTEMDNDSDHSQLMEIILRESDRLNKIVTDYLNYARPRAAEMQEVDVRELIGETLQLLRNSPEITDGHSLREQLPNEPLIVKGDAEQLKQVCWNVTRNALRAMPDGGEFSVTAQRTDSDRVHISFRDTGCGMTPEQVERLFEPFTSTTGGTGLGLSIVYQIIRDHSGTINVRSREGAGTTITVELPGVN